MISHVQELVGALALLSNSWSRMDSLWAKGLVDDTPVFEPNFVSCWFETGHVTDFESRRLPIHWAYFLCVRIHCETVNRCLRVCPLLNGWRPMECNGNSMPVMQGITLRAMRSAIRLFVMPCCFCQRELIRQGVVPGRAS
jgi:hypothetical protein